VDVIVLFGYIGSDVVDEEEVLEDVELELVEDVELLLLLEELEVSLNRVPEQDPRRQAWSQH
jgi:hypothetical protein